MAFADGGEGFIGARYIRLWRVEELIERNQKHSQYAPDLFLIGSNGGGEAYAFNLGAAGDAIYQVPFIGLDPKDALKVADSFDLFVPRINLTRSPIS